MWVVGGLIQGKLKVHENQMCLSLASHEISNFNFSKVEVTIIAKKTDSYLQCYRFITGYMYWIAGLINPDINPVWWINDNPNFKICIFNLGIRLSRQCWQRKTKYFKLIRAQYLGFVHNVQSKSALTSSS